MTSFCTRCHRALRNPQYVGGDAYGSTCFLRVGGVPAAPAARATRKRVGRRAVVASPVGQPHPDQLDFFADDLQFARRVDAVLAGISLEVGR